MEKQSQISGKSVNCKQSAQPRPTSFYSRLRRQLSRTPARIPLLWLRHHNFCPTDVFIASYPRSGGTCLRFTLFEMLSGCPSGFTAVNTGIRGVGHHRTGWRLLPGEGRLINTHEQYRKQYKKAIYVLRDARDVALSEFAYTRALEFFQGDLDEFLRTFLCGKINAFGPWQRHVASWLDSPIAATSQLLVVRFEDLRRNPVEAFSRIVDFLGVKVDDGLIQQAVHNNRLEKMQEKERQEPVRASVKGRFVRSGSVQGWRSKLSAEQLRMIEEHAGRVLARLGYPLSDGTAAEPAISADPMLELHGSVAGQYAVREL